MLRILTKALPAALFLAALAAAPAQAADADWASFRHDAANSGFNPAETAISPANAGRLRVLWKAHGKGSFVVSGGMAYVEGLDPRKIVAYDARTGTQKWAGGGPMPFLGVADGIIFGNVAKANLLALDAKDGRELWSHPSGGFDMGFNARNGVLYVYESGGVVAYRAKDGKILWKAALGADGCGNPAVAGDRVYATATPPSPTPVPPPFPPGTTPTPMGYINWMLNTPSTALGSVQAINAADGKIAWSTKLDGALLASPAVADGAVYVGTSAGTLFALDASTGAVKWKAEDKERRYPTSPAVAYGKVFTGSATGKVYAFAVADGHVVWTARIGAMISSPAVANGVVFIGSFDKRLYAFDAASGRELWKFATDEAVSASPAIANGIVYVGSNEVAQENTAYAFALPKR